MKLIYIEASKEEIQANKTLAEALGDAIGGFMDGIIKIKPVLEKSYSLIDEDENKEEV